MKLTEDELRFYSRQILLDEIGYKGQQKLKIAEVCIVGLGGLGSTVAIQLTAMGVGHLKLVDRDFVEESNLQRQHLYSFDVIGFPKVEAAVNRLRKLNPYVELEPLPLSLSQHNAELTLKGTDLVIDGLDNMRTRYTVNRACAKLGIPYIFGAAVSTFGNISTIIPNETACLECFYGKLDDAALPNCGTVGVHPAILGVIASIEVSEAVKLLTIGQPRLANRLLYCDVSSLRFEEIKVAAVENCPICGSKPETIITPLKHLLVEELCGRNNRRTFIVTPAKTLALDMGKLRKILKDESIYIEVESELGTVFSSRGISASLLDSGIMVVEGTRSDKETLDFYREIVVDKLRTPHSQIGFD
ncbi:MAG: HesA/MoeB/ThiF family protein [Candidatus Bathyarchaeota archaeon]|nr:HesA/MoeB/ThiF family protein [Candidatus Bathyarchaeota archaeon]